MKWRRRRRRGKKGENEEEAEGEDKRRKREWGLLCMYVHVCQEMSCSQCSQCRKGLKVRLEWT